MTETIKVNGMMCNMCEAHVKKELEKIDGVESAKADHNNGTAVIEATKPIAEEDLKHAVEEAGYTYAGLAS